MKLFRVSILAAVAAAIPISAAVPPGLVTYQGVIRNAAGSPLDGSYDMVFRFTDAPSAGTLLLTDYHTGPNHVTVTGGLFTTLLGAGTLSPGLHATLADVFASHPDVWLEVQVGAETLSPRLRIVSAGFAINAGRLGGQPAAEFLDRGAASQTKAGTLGSSSGLVGNAPGAGNGVEGTSATGTGVRGVANAAAGAAYGVHGRSSSTEGSGVAGEATASSGSAWGVYGKTSSVAGLGVLGSALAGSGTTEGVRGQSTSPSGRGVVGAAFSTTGDARGVYGESQSLDGTGVWGRATSATGPTTGVGGEAFSTAGIGVAGLARATSGDAWGVYGGTTSPSGYGVVSTGDSITDGDIYATGSKYFVIEHPFLPDRQIRYACLEGGQVGVYARGTGKLSGGSAKVRLPEHFPLVAGGRITVHLTPLGESAGLFAPEEEISTDAFVVREAGGGASNAGFSWIVVADRIGHDGQDAVQPLPLERKVFTSKRLSASEKASLRLALVRAGVAELTQERRHELFGLVHDGDHAGACRLLGGCDAVASPSTSLAIRGGSRPDNTGVRTAAASAPSDERAESRLAQPIASAAKVGSIRSAPAPDTVATADPSALDRSPSPRGAYSLAEYHPVSEPVENGDVVVVDPRRRGELRPGSTAADSAVVGVVAGATAPIATGDLAPVALSGTVWCKVDARYGPVAPGDLLTTSPTPGHAMRATIPGPGTILGKALEPLATGSGQIQVLVLLR